MDLEVRDEIASLRSLVVAGFGQLGRQIALLADQQSRATQLFDERISTGFRQVDERITLVERRLSDLDVRLTTMLAEQVRARTEDLDRWMQHEDRLRRLEKS